MIRLVVFIAWVGLIVSGGAAGQPYPNKPIRIVTGESGGGNDIAARAIAQWLSGGLGQPVVVENRVLRSQSMESVAKALPDGYSLLVTSNLLWILPLFDKMPYDPVRDFAPITWATNSPQIMAVLATTPVKSVKDLIALAKAKPGALNYGSGPAGSPSHLAGELFKSMAGVDIVVVPYRGGAPALNALLGGEVQIILPTAGVIMPHVKSGRARALAVTSAQPSALVPDLPTVAASLPGFEVGTIVAVYAPAKTPAAIINTLRQEIVRGLSRADVKATFADLGLETIGGSPEQLAAEQKADTARMGKIIKSANIKLSN